MGIRLNAMTVGDTWSFLVSAADFPAPTWVLTLYLTPRFTAPAQGQIVLTAAAEGADHRFAVAASVTATFAAGQYGYATRAASGAEKYTLDATQWSGEVALLPDPAALAQGADNRSQAQKAVDDLLAALASFTASQGTVVEYEINGRRMKFGSQAEIEERLGFWRRERARELRAEAIARGQADPSKVYVAFVR